MKGQLYAVGAGLLAAAATVCSKFAVASGEATALCEAGLAVLRWRGGCEEYLFGVRIAAAACVIAANVVMWTTFTKALRHCSNSVEATVTSTAANILCTAMLGTVIFGERLTLLWWVGAVLVLAGLTLLHHGRVEGKPTAVKRKAA